MKGDRMWRDVKRNCAFHKDIGHNTVRCVALKDEIERIIRAGHFKEFVDKPYVSNREERPWQRSLEKVWKVLTIIGGSHLAGESHRAHDKYARDAKTPPSAQVYRIEEWPAKHAWSEVEDIVFIETDVRWVHHPHVDALVITAWIANSNVHRLMVDDGSTMDILYLDTCKRMWLVENTLSLATSQLYKFTRDHIIPKGMAKLVITMGEHPRTSIVIANFVVVNCQSAIDGIIRRPLLKTLKAVTSTYLLTMKFPTIEGTGEV